MPHPYLHGNFAPICSVKPLTPCEYVGGIPDELSGGQYLRNGGNPAANEDLARDAHWFDGDGMLSGVAFRKRTTDGTIQPEFVNQFILTDVFLATITTKSLRSPLLPSIATLVNPASSLLKILLRIFRTIFLVILSNLPGSQQAIRKISVANTGILYHDGRALATCESGVPIRINLPGLETVGWFDGKKAEGEAIVDEIPGETFGGNSLLSFMKEWTTAHPKVDPHTNEMLTFHSTFFGVNYSIIPSTMMEPTSLQPRLLNASVPGISSPKMMHDFGASLSHTVILDLPLSLDPRNLARNSPVVSYDPSGISRFGVFPRWKPDEIRWFLANPCCVGNGDTIFHTANTWDELEKVGSETKVTAVNMLVCRLTSASLVFSAGDIAVPVPQPNVNPIYAAEEEQCRLYFYSFSMSSDLITHQFALSSIPFEFPSIRADVSMSAARYIYGCSVSESSFGAALGRAVKIDSLVKIDALALIAKAQHNLPTPITGCVDKRSVSEILASDDPNDPIKIFKLPEGFYAQESRFVPRETGKSEDDGWIISYIFDESQLDLNGDAPPDAKSELWIIEAKEMKEVVCKIKLPQRVPYGLHGSWFSETQILNQRPVETIRSLPNLETKSSGRSNGAMIDVWMDVRRWMLDIIG